MKNAVVDVHDAKAHLSKLMERARAGEVIVLAKAGEPYAQLAPLSRKEPVQRVLGRMVDWLPPVDDAVFFEALPHDELVAWEGGSDTS